MGLKWNNKINPFKFTWKGQFFFTILTIQQRRSVQMSSEHTTGRLHSTVNKQKKNNKNYVKGQPTPLFLYFLNKKYFGPHCCIYSKLTKIRGEIFINPSRFFILLFSLLILGT